MPLILSGNVASATADAGYSVANSCRFNFADSAYLSKTFDAAGNQKTFTLSTWIKRGNLGISYPILYGGAAADAVYFTAEDQLLVICGSGSDDRRISTMVFRDTSAWYHIVQKFDTTQGTAADRYTLYVNGTEAATSVVGGKNEITQDVDIALFYNAASYIGFDGSSDYFDGYMAETVHIDGTALAASSFGEFNEDSPNIWQPKDVSGLTFGTNGFYLDYEDSSALGNDVSGNNNDFAVTNLAAADQATDTPTNNFATLNPLVTINGSNFTEGNCKIVTGSSPYSYDVSTIAVTNGKWYVEAQYGGDSDDATFGIAGRLATATTHELGQYNDTWSYYTGTGASNIRNNDSNSSYGNTYAADDIIGLAVDLTNNKLYFSKNGTWQNSGDPESGATGTGAVDITAVASVTEGVYYIGIGDFDGGASVTWSINFGGCPAYAISSGNADANGYGNFEYAVPEGYFSLNTKNLAEYG